MIALALGKLAGFLGLGGVDVKGWAWLGVAAGALGFAIWISTALYLAGVHAEQVKTLEATIAKIKADLAANEEITEQAEIDAAILAANDDELRKLLDELRKKPRGCALTRDHVDGVRRIDASP